MAQKCRICGYKFKAGDGSLCPECFTARDEELRFEIRKDSTDDLFGNKRKEELGSFLADEMRQEFHEDISMKKSLDREDTQRTKSFTAEGAHVKNETFKDAFIERKSRDTSNQGRVYTNNKSSQPKQVTPSPQLTGFLDSIDPTLKNRIYGDQQTQDPSKFRYSHHTSNQDLTSNQQMLYGINAGKAPSTSSAPTTITYNFPPRTNQTKYSKGSNSKAAIVIIISVVIFIMIINILEEVSDSVGNSNNDNETMSNAEVIADSQKDPYYEHEMTAQYGEYTMHISNYKYGDKEIDPNKSRKYQGYSYPSGEWDITHDTFREMMLEFLIQTDHPEAEVPDLDDMLLYAYNEAGELCACNGYNSILTPSKNTEGEYTLVITFLVPKKAVNYDLGITYSTTGQAEQYSRIEKFTTELIDEWNGKHNDGSSEAS